MVKIIPRNRIKKINDNESEGKTSKDNYGDKLNISLDSNVKKLRELMKDNQLVVFRKFENTENDNIKCCLIFANGMADKDILNSNVIDPIMNSSIGKDIPSKDIINFLINKVITTNQLGKAVTIEVIISVVMAGDGILLIDGCSEAIVIYARSMEGRQIDEPITETVVRGPREAFTEAIETNISLIRKRIKSYELKMVLKDIGTLTKTKICICYMENIASPKILDELYKRLDKIEVDGIFDSGYIQEIIKDEPLSPFKTIGDTERPDVVCGKLLEGRIGIICDGTPFVLTLPFLFLENFQISEDYYDNFAFASFNRLLRWIAYFLTTSVPGLYIAFTTFHQEMIPTPLLLSISSARQGVPFPTTFEAFGMIIVFEILREAGVRLPKPIGQTISIVGALVLGDAAVTARIISAPMIIVTSLTGISSFLIPKLLGPIVVIRFIIIFLSSFLGLYGYIFGMMGLYIHLMSMRSFGVPYMMNVGVIDASSIKDTVVRYPLRLLKKRPRIIGQKNPVRKS
ncbi:MAG: spore germination protein [Clostridiales bacterium]|jgi:spore germination protein KA|nr:spore germination protein [Clostridiales bacterium]